MRTQFIGAWNTGAHYTVHGQRIGLWFVLDGDAAIETVYVTPDQYDCLLLIDYDRGIEYLIEPPRAGAGRTRTDLIEYAMRSYQWNENIRPGYVDERPRQPESFPLRRFG